MGDDSHNRAPGMTCSRARSLPGQAWLPVLSLCVAVASGCAREIGGAFGDGNGDGGPDAGDGSKLADGAVPYDPFNNAGPMAPITNTGSVALPDGGTAADSFFINDPAPPYCGPEADRPADMPTGTVDCPSDKNREGCPCPQNGMSAACWPGKRLNRNHGICKDGMTTCMDTPEFGLRWGQCNGYVLPQADALAGPNACRCFSAGTWQLSNLAPCIVKANSGTYLYSSTLSADGKIQCGSNIADPPPVPSEDWGTSLLNVDCAGQFKLCYTIKAGDAENPHPEDCTVMQTCVDTWYPQASTDQSLPSLPGWVSTDTACAAQFEQSGGYGEMSVIGESIECDVVDDGKGNPYVFHRTDYCPPSCQSTPDTPECRVCQTGGSGMFQ